MALNLQVANPAPPVSISSMPSSRGTPGGDFSEGLAQGLQPLIQSIQQNKQLDAQKQMETTRLAQQQKQFDTTEARAQREQDALLPSQKKNAEQIAAKGEIDLKSAAFEYDSKKADAIAPILISAIQYRTETDPEKQKKIMDTTYRLAKAKGLSEKDISAYKTDNWDEFQQIAGGLLYSHNKISEAQQAIINQKMIDGKAPNPEIAKQQFENEKYLRRDYMNATNTFQAISDGYGRFNSSISTGTAAGDMSSIFAYMKMLDPTSTVREGEYATVKNAGSVPTLIQQTYNKALSGQIMVPEMRSQFSEQADKLYETALKNNEVVRKQFEDNANKSGADPSNVIIQYSPLEKKVTDVQGNTFTMFEVQQAAKQLSKRNGQPITLNAQLLMDRMKGSNATSPLATMGANAGMGGMQ